MEENLFEETRVRANARMLELSRRIEIDNEQLKAHSARIRELMNYKVVTNPPPDRSE